MILLLFFQGFEMDECDIKYFGSYSNLNIHEVRNNWLSKNQVSVSASIWLLRNRFRGQRSRVPLMELHIWSMHSIFTCPTQMLPSFPPYNPTSTFERWSLFFLLSSLLLVNFGPELFKIGYPTISSSQEFWVQSKLTYWFFPQFRL